MSICNMQIKDKNHFNVSEEFFLIDSDTLQGVRTRMYGFSVQNTGIFEEGNITDQAIDALDGCGCYIYIQATDEEIRISQDFNGSWGIYLYQKDGYFALSSSFCLLLEHVKKQGSLTIDRDYCNHLFANSLVSHSYSGTPVNEIELVDKNAIITIDKKTCQLRISYIDYQENQISIDSAEGISIIDQWIQKWAAVLCRLKKKTDNIVTDLSGGFDSRMTLMLMLKSGIDLNQIRVNSIKDNLHTHAEDYAIASEIAARYNFELNKPMPRNRQIHYSLEDVVNLSYYTKMAFHKEMQIKTGKKENKVYTLTGSGGESVRDYWKYTANEFIEYMKKDANRYPAGLQSEMKASIESIVRNSYDQIQKKYGITDMNSRRFPLYLYREVRSRNHFGKGTVERFFSNTYDLTPLIDPLLYRLNLEDPVCDDKNLLFALIYVRHCPELLEFRYDGGREIRQETISRAMEINSKYAPYEEAIDQERNFDALVVDTQVSELLKSDKNPALDYRTVHLYLKKVFDSVPLMKSFSAQFDEEIYHFAKKYYTTTGFHPMRHCYAVMAIQDVIAASWQSRNLNDSGIMERFGKLIEDSSYIPSEPETIPTTYYDAVTARVDVIFSPERETGTLQICTSKADMSQPAWMQKHGIGYMINSRTGSEEIRIVTKGTGKLSIRLRSKDIRGKDGKQLCYWLDYTNVFFDGKKEMMDKTLACHNKPIDLIILVNSEEREITLRYDWKPHTAFDFDEMDRLSKRVAELERVVDRMKSM